MNDALPRLAKQNEAKRRSFKILFRRRRRRNIFHTTSFKIIINGASHHAYLHTERETAYTDDDCSYASNEIAINWNPPAVYLFNALQAIKEK